MAIFTEETKSLLLSALGNPAARDEVIAEFQSLQDQITAIPASPISVLSTNITPVAVSGVSGTLMTYSVPAGTLAANGDSLEVYASGTYVISSSSQLTATLGGQTVCSNFQALDPDGQFFQMNMKLTRLSATSVLVYTQRYCSKPDFHFNPDHSGLYSSTITLTLANALTLQLSVASNNGTVTQNMMQVKKVSH